MGILFFHSQNLINLKKIQVEEGVLLSVVLARVDGRQGQKADGEPSSAFSFLYIALGTHQCHA